MPRLPRFLPSLLAVLGVVAARVAPAQVVISEFLASNNAGLTDEDGERSDWIEIHNPGTQTASLLDWSLTDDAANLNKWKFPTVTLTPGARLVVFASSKNRRSPSGPLHTNFRLDAEGEFLGLVRPDGTLATDFAPIYPSQLPDVSFGLVAGTVTTPVLSPAATARLLVPANGTLGESWTSASFDDTGWMPATASIGFETGQNEYAPGVAGDVLADNPLAYWRLSEASGGVVAGLGSLSAQGQVLNGALLGQEGPRPAVFNGFEATNVGARFDGVNDKIDVEANPAFNPPSFSIEAWARPAEAGGSLRSVVTCRDSSPTRGFAIYAGDDGRWQFWLGNGVGWSVGTGPPAVPGSWSHLVGTYDSGTQSMRFFVNGVLAEEQTSTYQQNTARPLRIGAGRTETSGEYFFNGDVDEVALFDRPLSAEEISRRYALASTGTGGDPTFNYSGHFQTDLRNAMHGISSSAYLRIPFQVATLDGLSKLTLRVRHDDGLAIWLNGVPAGSANAPVAPQWDSVATAANPPNEAIQEELFDLTEHISALRGGANVLALQGLNLSKDNPDFLLSVQLDLATVNDDTSVPAYFITPTPNHPNSTGAASPGPLISEAAYSPAPPTGPTANDDLTITCRVTRAFAPIAEVKMTWRIMFTPAQQSAMFDDGQHGDGGAGDGIYGAILPKSAYTQGQLVRWFFTAADQDGRTSRWPLFTSPTNSPEFLGTMITDPRVSTQLPVWYWFAATPAAANSRTGTRGALFFNGELRDNIHIRQRGGATSTGSRKFDFNTGFHAWINEEIGRVEEANINGTSSDPTLIRPSMAFETYRRTGHPAGIAFPLMLRANAGADTSGGNAGLAYFVEQPDERMLERLGLDREGALYKMDQRSDLNPVFTDTTNGVQKNTRVTENRSDLQAVVDALKSTTPIEAREIFMFDNFDVGNLVNYLAVRAIINDSDDVRKNFYFYRDTNDSREWKLLPWDKDWTFGVAGDGGQWWTHPFFGDEAHKKDNAGQWNRLWDALHKNPRTQAMYLRRLRTLMDTMLEPPTPAPAGGYDFEKRADAWFAPLDPHTSQTVSSIKSWLPQRRTQLFTTFIDLPTNANASRRIIPAAPQDPNVLINFGAIDANPSSGRQDDEYVELVNPGNVAVDISGWRVRGGIEHTLRPGSVLLPNSSLYLANEASSFRSRTSGPRGAQGLFVQGNYDGSLSARGETLQLVDPRDPESEADDRIVAALATPAQPTAAQQQLRLTELMFHPLPGGAFNEEEYEYVELTNVGATPLDLTGATFTDGIGFTFAAGGPHIPLGAGARMLLVKNPAAFTGRYGSGFAIAGTYEGSLSNNGERIRLVDAVGEEVLDFEYADDWQPGTDGGGFSLVLRDIASPPESWAHALAWRSSLVSGGSPGAGEATPVFRFAPGDLAIAFIGANITVDFVGAPSQAYVLESSDDLLIWQARTSFRTDASGLGGFTDAVPSDSRFYRVRSAPGQ